MDQPGAGYREIQHTADWQLEVWAPDLPGLFEQAARGMAALAGIQLGEAAAPAQHLEFVAQDAESLLVKFLGELLYLQEQHGLGCERFDLAVSEGHLTAELAMRPVIALEKQIKAVTYHNLAIQPTPRGLEARIVFDV